MTRILAILAALALAACQSGGTSDTKADIQQGLALAELAYTGAKISLSVFCASSPNVPPCNSAAAMAHVEKATIALDAAFAGARRTIEAARGESDVQTALVAFSAALETYRAVMQSYGLSRGGG